MKDITKFLKLSKNVNYVKKISTSWKKYLQVYQGIQLSIKNQKNKQTKHTTAHQVSC